MSYMVVLCSVSMCMHVQVFSSSAILVLHAYMHGAAASSLDEPPLTWRVLWIVQQVQNLPHGVLESVQGATVEPGSWVFQPMITDIAGGLLRIRKRDLVKIPPRVEYSNCFACLEGTKKASLNAVGKPRLLFVSAYLEEEKLSKIHFWFYTQKNKPIQKLVAFLFAKIKKYKINFT